MHRGVTPKGDEPGAFFLPHFAFVAENQPNPGPSRPGKGLFAVKIVRSG